MTSSERGNVSVVCKASRLGNEPKINKTRSKTSTSRKILSSSTRMSSKDGQQDSTTSNHTYDSIDNELNTEDEDNQEDCAKKHHASQQEYDLLGLALQTSTNRLPSNEADTSNVAPQAVPQGHQSACPIHSGFFSNADAIPIQTGELKQLPMDRYLAEGLAERYVLLSIGPSENEGQWARYAVWTCRE